MTITEIGNFFDQNRENLLEEFSKFLRFESISSEPAFRQPLLDCCQWVADQLVNMGMTVEVWESREGHPCIYAENLEAGPNQPTLLLYNHYDVQPVDPLELWENPPFDPAIRNGEIYARGAEDNKGQCFYTLQAVKFLLKRDGKLPINVKWIIEGEEESGSRALADLIPKKKDQLKADYLAIVDMGLQDLKTPQVNIGVRGIVTFDLELTGSSTDLHSGTHGGMAYNPNRALVEMLAKLWDENGKVTVPHFYDDVEEISPHAKKLICLDFDAKDYKKTFGAEATGGEKAYSPNERAWLRPTLEINGINGGYSGEGFKTVIPAKAKAKLSCRLVPNQNPDTIGKHVVDHIKTLTPPGITCNIHLHGWGFPVRSKPESPIVQAFAKAYSEVFRKPCGFTMGGGSIPITTALNNAAGSEVVLMGLGLPDDNIHAPNEHFGIERIKLGMQIIARTLEILNKKGDKS